MEKWLKDVYYKPTHPASFSGAAKLFKLAKEVFPEIKLKQVKTFLQKQDVYTVFREARFKFKRNITPVHKIDFNWQIDSLYMQDYAADNDMYKFVCCAIDTFSRYAWVRPLKTLTSAESAAALSSIFEGGRQPTFSLRSDAGSEYIGKPFQKLLEQEGIKHFISRGELKSSLVERFNANLKKRLMKTMYSQNDPRWVDYLQECCEGYNKSPHSSLGGLPPSEVNKNNEDEVRLTQYLVRERRKKKKKSSAS
jgi:transposase InsO family protein